MPQRVETLGGTRRWKWLKERPDMERVRYTDKTTGVKRIGEVQITSEWIEQMGGRVEVETKPGHWLISTHYSMGCFVKLYITGPDMPLCDEGSFPETVDAKDALTWRQRD